uniref:Uncharacterized protein n=1 Tax=Arundo donax TaxID=35708 RepID=A0A0A9E5S5_ARUDO
MQVVAFCTHDLVGAREEDDRHLLTQAHDALPVALNIIKIDILLYQNWSIAVLSPFRKTQCVVFVVCSPLGSSNVCRVQGQFQLRNLLLKSTKLTLVSLHIILGF